MLELDIAVHTLSFFSCGQHLQMNWGVLDISFFFRGAASHLSDCFPSLFVANNWVTERQKTSFGFLQAIKRRVQLLGTELLF